jgi:predicted AlkP superfamily phosphohydrolase/phosphomutase
MSIFKKNKRNRGCVIGLDGVPFAMLKDLARRDIMPATARLIESGHLHRMKASLPEISAVSWTDFMTGTNAGSHGIFGFTDFKPGSYGIRFPNFGNVRTETFWDTLGAAGKRSIIINQPSTYPARKIEGILVSGFVALEIGKAVYPPACRASLERIGYQIDIDTVKARSDRAFLWQELDRTMTGRRKAFDLFWKEPWDYFEFVVTGTDRLHHFLWNAYEDEAHPEHGRFIDYYRRLDGVIAGILDAFRKLTGTDEGLHLMSDHGFCGIVQEVYLNAWLEREGYLEFVSASPRGFEDIGPKTTAFALDPNRIYLNRVGRFPAGTVQPGDTSSLRAEIARKIETLEYGGRKAVRKVFMAEDIYQGPLADQGPDLIVLGENGFDMKGSLKKKDVFGRTDLQGMHTWDDALFWAASEKGSDLAISDLAKIILENFR